MMRMGKHIYGLDACHAVIGIENGDVARLRSRITTYIHNPLRRSTEYGTCDVLVDTGSGRIEDHDVKLLTSCL